jgi:hypothetical protein
MNCPNCGNVLPDNAAFCNLCGISIQKYSPPDGFIRDPNSGFYYRMEYDGLGANIGATWFNAMTGEYDQVQNEPEPEVLTEPSHAETMQNAETPIAAVADQVPIASSIATQPTAAPPIAAPPTATAHHPPEGFTFDQNSGYYYIYTNSVNSQTGASEQWITWFDPNTGGYMQELQRIEETDKQQVQNDAITSGYREGMQQLSYEAKLRPMGEAKSKKQAKSRASSPPAALTLLCILALLVSIAAPIATVWMTVSGLKIFVTEQVNQIEYTTVNAVSDAVSNFSLDAASLQNGAVSFSDHAMLLIAAAREVGGGTIWLIIGLLMWLLLPLVLLFAMLSSQGAPRFCGVLVIISGILATLGGGGATYGLSRFLRIVPLPEPYVYAFYVMLAATVMIVIISFICSLILKVFRKKNFA